MVDQDTRRKDRKKKRKPVGDGTPLQTGDVLPFTIDPLPTGASAPTPDPAPSWDSGFDGGDTGGGGGGGDF